MQIGRMERAVILGASRGLGAELAKFACDRMCPVMGFGRKKEMLAAIQEQYPLFEYRVTDFSRANGQDEALRYLLEADYHKVFCVAGGGPYGPFHERAMKDHDWAWEVSFHFPARVAHALLSAKKRVQLIFVGSAVAESAPDLGAASYCAAKHALKGLFSTLRLESPGFDVRLFSPGYMDTDLLPKNAAVRQRGVYDPKQIAVELWDWSLAADESGHRVYPPHPIDR